MQVLWTGQMGAREIEGRVNVSASAPWTAAPTDVSAASPPPPVSPAPSASAPPSSASAPLSSAAPAPAAGTDSSPAWSSAGPADEANAEPEGRWVKGKQTWDEGQIRAKKKRCSVLYGYFSKCAFPHHEKGLLVDEGLL